MDSELKDVLIKGIAAIERLADAIESTSKVSGQAVVRGDIKEGVGKGAKEAGKRTETIGGKELFGDFKTAFDKITGTEAYHTLHDQAAQRGSELSKQAGDAGILMSPEEVKTKADQENRAATMTTLNNLAMSQAVGGIGGTKQYIETMSSIGVGEIAQDVTNLFTGKNTQTSFMENTQKIIWEQITSELSKGLSNMFGRHFLDTNAQINSVKTRSN